MTGDITKEIRALLNKLSEGSLESVCKQLVALSQQTSVEAFQRALSNSLLRAIGGIEASQGEQILLHCNAAVLVANATDMSLAHVVVNGLVGAVDRGSRAHVMALVGLYRLGAVGSGIVYELLGEKAADCSEESIDTLLAVVESAGGQLRRDNPRGLRALIEQVGARAAGGDGAPSLKMEILVEMLGELKNNRARGGAEEVERMQKRNNQFMRNMGGVRHEQIESTLAQARLNVVPRPNSGGDVAAVGLAQAGGDDVESELLRLAREHHMHTPLRKSIFVAVMGAVDEVDGEERLRKLRLKREEEKEAVYVVLHCVGREQTYNAYYEQLLVRLAMKKQARQAVERGLREKIGEAEMMEVFSVMNYGRLAGRLMVRGVVGLGVLGVKTGTASTKEMLMYRVGMQVFMTESDERVFVEQVERFVRRRGIEHVGGKREMHVFVLKKLGKAIEAGSAALLKTRRSFILKTLNTFISTG